MSKIQIPRLPQATPEYSQQQQNTLVQTLDQLIFLLNKCGSNKIRSFL